MKNKKVLALAAIFALASPLAACGNQEDKSANENNVEMAEPTAEDVNKGDVAVEPAPANENTDKEAAEGGSSSIHDLKTSYLPEDFEENFKDEKNDLITAEYSPKNNPAKKITVQISDNPERMAELVKVPEGAEEIKIGENSGNYWDDGSFNYIYIKDDQKEIYTRSTLEKEEAVKVVEGIK